VNQRQCSLNTQLSEPIWPDAEMDVPFTTTVPSASRAVPLTAYVSVHVPNFCFDE
jgi:hypothetical protein